MGHPVANRSSDGSSRTCLDFSPRKFCVVWATVVLSTFFRVASGQNSQDEVGEILRSKSSFFTPAPFTIVLCLCMVGFSFATAYFFRQYGDRICGWYGFAYCCPPEEDDDIETFRKKEKGVDVEKNERKSRHKRKRPPAILLTKYENENEIWKAKVDYYLQSLASTPDLHYNPEEDENILNYKPTLRRKNIAPTGAPPSEGRWRSKYNSKRARTDNWLGRKFGATSKSKRKLSRKATPTTATTTSAANSVTDRPKTAAASDQTLAGGGRRTSLDRPTTAATGSQLGRGGLEERSAASRTSTVAWAKSSNKYFPPEVAYAKGSLDPATSGVEVIKRKPRALKKSNSNLYQRKYDVLLRRNLRKVGPSDDDDGGEEFGDNGDDLNTQRNEELIDGNAASRTVLLLSTENGESQSSPSRPTTAEHTELDPVKAKRAGDSGSGNPESTVAEQTCVEPRQQATIATKQVLETVSKEHTEVATSSATHQNKTDSVTDKLPMR